LDDEEEELPLQTHSPNE
jgi:hypothetical protein